MNHSASFRFVERPTAYRDDEAEVARIPSGIRSKRELLSLLADQLRFPIYFGWNWDALSDCLRDLSWLPEQSRVVVIHEALPLKSAEQRRNYVDVLSQAMDFWTAEQPRKLSVVFPAADRVAIFKLSANPE